MITCDPNKMNPEQFLQYLQDFYAQLNGISMKESAIALSDDDIEGIAHRYNKALSKIIPEGNDLIDSIRKATKGRIELQGDESVIKRAIETTRKLMSPAEQKVFSAIPVGMVPHRLFNAHSIRVPEGGDVIVLNLGMIGGLNIINTFILDVFLSRSPQDIRNDVEGFVHDVLDFVLLLRRGVLFDQKIPPLLHRFKETSSELYTLAV